MMLIINKLLGRGGCCHWIILFWIKNLDYPGMDIRFNSPIGAITSLSSLPCVQASQSDSMSEKLKPECKLARKQKTKEAA